MQHKCKTWKNIWRDLGRLGICCALPLAAESNLSTEFILIHTNGRHTLGLAAAAATGIGTADGGGGELVVETGEALSSELYPQSSDMGETGEVVVLVAV